MGFNRSPTAPSTHGIRVPRTASCPAARSPLTQAWVSVLAGGGPLRRRGGAAQPALPRAESRWRSPGCSLYSLSKRFTWWPHLWLGLEPRDRAGGRLPRGHRTVERAGLAAARHHRRGGHLGGRVRHLLRPARRGLRPGRGTSERGRPAGRARGRFCWPSCCTGSPCPRWRSSAGARGSALWYYVGRRSWPPAILAYEHRLVRPGDLSRLDAAFFTMNGVMSLTVFAFALVDRLSGDARAPARPRDHRRIGRAVRRSAARGARPAPRCRSGSSPASTGCGCCARSAESTSSMPCARSTGAGPRVIRVFPDGDRGALPASGSQRTAGW